MGKEKPKILFAEEDRDLAESIERFLSGMGYEVNIVYDGAQALVAFEQNRYSLIVLSENLSRVSTENVVRSLKKASSAPILLISEKNFSEKISRDFGYSEAIFCPFTAAEFKEKIERLINESVPTNSKKDEENKL